MRKTFLPWKIDRRLLQYLIDVPALFIAKFREYSRRLESFYCLYFPELRLWLLTLWLLASSTPTAITILHFLNLNVNHRSFQFFEYLLCWVIKLLAFLQTLCSIGIISCLLLPHCLFNYSLSSILLWKNLLLLLTCSMSEFWGQDLLRPLEEIGRLTCVCGKRQIPTVTRKLRLNDCHLLRALPDKRGVVGRPQAKVLIFRSKI